MRRTQREMVRLLHHEGGQQQQMAGREPGCDLYEVSFEIFYGVNRKLFELENEGRGGENIFPLSQFSLSTLSNRVSKIETDLHLNMAYLLNNTSVKTHEIIVSLMNTLAEIQKEKMKME